MSLFEANDLKAFLRAYIGALPNRGRGEVSKLARHLRVSSTLVSQVLSGSKTFTPEQTQSLATYLGCTSLETDYLTFLNQVERAGTKQLRDYWKKQLDSIRQKSLSISNRVVSDRVLSEQERTTFYSSAIYSAVRLFCSTDDNGKTLDEVATRFELSRNRANDILQFLVSTGLCDEKNHRIVLGVQKTHIEQGSPHLLRHYSNWRIRAIRHSEELTSNELMYTAPVSISKKDFEALREEMVQFIKKFLARVHESPAEDIACLNMDWFWIKK